MWRENVAFDNKFITKKSLKLHLNLSWFKFCTISPKKTAIYSSRYLQSMKRHLQAAILKGYLRLGTRLKTFSLDFPFSWLVFVIGFNNNTISFFYFLVFHVIFIKIMAKKGIDIFSTGYPPWYIIIAISLSRLVLVIGFNNNSINAVSFSIYFPFYVIFIKKWQKTSDCNFQHRAPIMDGCWRTSASSCCKSWRGSCGHRS